MRPEFRKPVAAGAEIKDDVRGLHQLVDHGKEKKPILAM
jgi:hypothetical protein